MDTDWIYMALASLGRLILEIFKNERQTGQRGQCEMDLHGIGIPGILDLRHPSRQTNPWIPVGYPWHWHPWVDWHSWSPGQSWILDTVFRVEGNLQIHGYPWDIHGIGIPG